MAVVVVPSLVGSQSSEGVIILFWFGGLDHCRAVFALVKHEILQETARRGLRHVLHQPHSSSSSSKNRRSAFPGPSGRAIIQAKLSLHPTRWPYFRRHYHM